ncbi:MAG: hypothetical protein C5B55_07860 [Blastocatellia bacterium]|nr:MAG: hypothetical protein C5B55_07860 [Blastocatellia bacterium]
MHILRWQQLLLAALCCAWLSSGLLRAQNLTVIGGTHPQRQLAACIEHITAGDLDKFPGTDHWMTIVILEHEKFLQMRDSFHAQRTKLAFSHIPSRRMYLSSRVFRDRDNAMRCIPHELGHFVTHSPYEGSAELAAERIRKLAREVCTMSIEPISARALSEGSSTIPLTKKDF